MKDRRKKVGRPQPAALAASQLYGWKLWRWRLLAVAGLPLFVLAVIELALRMTGFGYPTSFLLPSVNHNHATWVQNNCFGWRFFGKRLARVPRPLSIAQDKPSDTIRIFVFGESAAFGDPQPAFGLPRVLQTTLSLRHPHLKFEVVNAAMTAINSHVIVPLARDCARAHGDIWVVYMGNNEVVGPFGAGTIFGAQTPPLSLIRTTLALKSLRLGQCIDAAHERWGKSAANKSDWDGMAMFLDQEVRADDPHMANVYQNFERNLGDIIRAGHDSGAGVVVSTVAVNLKDCAPFATRNRPNLSEPEKRRWDELFQQGTQAQQEGKFAEAVNHFRAASEIDDSSAELQFRLGRCQLALGDNREAQKSLTAARDLDTLRFRCDSRLNDLIRRTAGGRENDRILMADAERSFADASSDRVPGRDWFYEHVHLTFEGNCLLARTLTEQIEKLLPRNASDANPLWPTVAECARRLGRTDRDLREALVSMLARLTKAPFKTQIDHDQQMQRLTAQARQLAEKDPAASLAHALEVTRSAVATSPDDAQLYEQLAALDRAAGHAADAEAAGRREVDLLPSSAVAWSQLGYTYVQEKKYEDAVQADQRAFDLNPEDVEPLQNLATALAQLGRMDDAVREFRRVVSISPGFGIAWVSLGQALERQGRKTEAEDCYRKGFENRINRAPELATLAGFCMSRGWFEAAATNYDDAMKLDPSDPAMPLKASQAHFALGMELGKSGHPAAAAREFKEAVRLSPDTLEARLNLGIALFNDGQWEQSSHEFEQVAARCPTNALAGHYLDLLRSKVVLPEHQ
jgi:tetratricopeptide (TPR) repeat protein